MLGVDDRLKRLEQERENILHAELAALLHDIGKFTDYQIADKSANKPLPPVGSKGREYVDKAVVDDPSKIIKLSKISNSFGKPEDLNDILSKDAVKFQKAADFIPAEIKNDVLEKLNVSLRGTSYCLAELIMLGFPGFAAHARKHEILDGKNGWLPALLGVCHADAHYDKPEIKNLLKRQNHPGTLASTAFGFENFSIERLTQKLKDELSPLILAAEAKFSLLGDLKDRLDYGVGDTRRPINEVRLGDWASSVAALFKAATAAAILNGKEEQIREWVKLGREIGHDVCWRLLRITFDGINFIERAATVSDLLGRREAIESALDEIRDLFESVYPMGSEIYRDENGAAFVMPALYGDDDDGSELHNLVDDLIYQVFLKVGLTEGEMVPDVHISKPDKRASLLHELLAKPVPPVRAFRKQIESWWKTEVADRCVACGVRPQGYGAPSNDLKQKARRRNVCYVCLKRRARRSQKWALARHGSDEQLRQPWRRTIWLDEVADRNGRLALIVGRFDLDEWLSGKMVETLLAACDTTNNNFTWKNASFARLRRIWRTTQSFWQQVQDEDIPAITSQDKRRLSIAVYNIEVYDKDPQQSGLGEFHVYEAELKGKRLSVVWDSKSKTLLTADNLQSWTGKDDGAAHLLSELPATTMLYEPGGYGSQRTPKATAHIDRSKSEIISHGYSPSIALLTQPQNFMALVPAAYAVEVATKISNRYELEMSKVRNRLPLHLGIIFFDRRQPLFSALDAGRRMLSQPLPPETFTLNGNPTLTRQNAPLHLDHNHFNQWQAPVLKDGSGDLLNWRISAVMGDGTTPDDWYPYYHVIADVSENPPTGRTRQFEREGKHWIHIEDLQNGDKVSIKPSRFDWVFLETSARRFDVGQEPALYLEELDLITGLWRRLKENGVTDSKLHQVVALLTIKQDVWNDAQQFRNLAESVRVNEELQFLSIEEITSGRLLRTFELYCRILKQSLKEK